MSQGACSLGTLPWGQVVLGAWSWSRELVWNSGMALCTSLSKGGVGSPEMIHGM